MGLFVLTSACVATPPAVTAVAPVIPTDPLLAFVSSGRVGQTAAVNEPSYGGAVSVVIQTQYNSAGGHVCRTYGVTNSTTQSQQLACDSGTTWYVVPPLMTSNN